MPSVESYEFGRIVVDGRTYTNDVIIGPDRVLSPWWRKEGHRLCIDDLKGALDFKPSVIVIGTGYYGCMVVPEEVRKLLEEMGIRVEIANTSKACSIYNELKETSVVVAALHLTC
jgi:hypothetical protein